MTVYYKYLQSDGTSIFGHGTWNLPDEGNPGEWMPEIKGELVECQNGYHACRRQDLPYWRGAILYELEFDGEVLEAEEKVLGRKARLLRRMENWNSNTQRLYAADCAERVLHLFEAKCPGDTRPRQAIELARRFTRREVDRDTLVAAHTAAVAAAHAADVAAYAAAAAAAFAADAAAAYAADAAVAATHAAAAADAAAAAFAADAAADADAAAYARKQERTWQAARLLAYLSGEVSS